MFELQEYFQQCRPLEHCTAEDAKLAAAMLLYHVREAEQKNKRAVAETFVERTVMLQEAQLHTLLGTLLPTRRMRPPEAINTADPSVLTEAETTTLARSMFWVIMKKAMRGPAVVRLLIKYLALRTLADRHAWLEPFVKELAVQLLRAVQFGLKLCVIARSS